MSSWVPISRKGIQFHNSTLSLPRCWKVVFFWIHANPQIWTQSVGDAIARWEEIAKPRFIGSIMDHPCLRSNLNPISCRRNCAISRPDDSEKELTLVALEREIEAILVRENRFNCQISENLQDWISFNGHGSEVWGCFELWSVFVECGVTLK